MNCEICGKEKTQYFYACTCPVWLLDELVTIRDNNLQPTPGQRDSFNRLVRKKRAWMQAHSSIDKPEIATQDWRQALAAGQRWEEQEDQAGQRWKNYERKQKPQRFEEAEGIQRGLDCLIASYQKSDSHVDQINRSRTELVEQMLRDGADDDSIRRALAGMRV